MDESLEILEKSLANSGVSIPQGVSSIKDLTPDTLFSICAQSLRLIDPSSSFPTSLPDSMADRFKICTDLASSVTNLGFIGDISFHKFLYPSEEDLYKLVRFLVRKLSELPKEVGEVSEKRDIIASTTTKENDFKTVPSGELTKKADNRRVDLSGDGVRTRLEDLTLNSEDAFVSGFLETHPLQQKIDTEAIPEISRSSMQDSSKEDTTSVQDDNESTKRVGKSYEESASQMDDKHVSEIEQKLISLSKQSSEIRYKIGKLRSQEKVLVEEASAKTVEAQHQEEEHELLKSVVEMAFDDQHNADFHITQLNEQVDSRRRHLLELETQWDTLRKSLEEKEASRRLYMQQNLSLWKS
ncbi:Coiled-coil domain-containing protein 22 [Camellia lanceoleosa]|uniref:Coiled-coil domain-containing protein 22 n=1 Tax=Camellia lanceoleosa TaxID=1840588 RepID=A0ACC0HAB4_9ERIC|nr:Coiled-coil domain-containing protein 22 [Camellia lanceoleosa]